MEVAPSLIGRDAEIQAISSFLDGLSAGSSALLLLGEPGIGKTSLLRAGAEAAGRRSHRILTCQPAESERGLSFAGLDDLIEEVLPEALPGLPGPQQRAIRAALLLEEASSVGPNPRAIALAVLGILRTLAQRAPVLVAIDDLQWVDAPSVSALEYAVRRLENEQVGLLATVRVEGTISGPPLEECFPKERVRRQTIGPLSLGAVHRLIVRRLGRALSRPALVRVHTVSGGNPFYALEMARALSRSEGSVDPGRPLPVPENLRDLLEARLAALPPAAREVLPAVAALANPTVSAVEAATASSRGTAALESAAEAGIIEIVGERVGFTHPLLASAAYLLLLPRRRRELHRRLAPLVSDREERARHLALGAEGPAETVANALEEAAAQAARRGAPDVAAELAEMASNMTPPEDPDTRVRRMVEAARWWNVAGELNRAHAMAQELLQGALTAAERADLLLLLAETSTDFETSIGLGERAAKEASADRARSVQIRQLIAQIRLVHEGIPTALADARRALELAQQHDDPALLVSSLSLVAAIETWAGDVTNGLLERGLALQMSLAAVEDRRPLQSWDLYYHPDFVSGLRFMYQGRLDEARTKLLPTYAQAAAVGDEPTKASILIILTELECRSGNWNLALQYATEGWEISEQIGLEHQGGAHAYTRALVHAHLGRVEEAKSIAERGLAMSEEIGDVIFTAQNASVLGFLELSLGDPAAADRFLRPLADRLEAVGWGEPGVYCVLPNAIEALVSLGELQEAQRLLRRLENQSRVTGSAWADATVRRCRGLLLAAEGDLSRATAVLVEALETHRRLPLPFEHARSLLVLGTCQRRAKQKGAARRTLQAALELFGELGASLWAERTRTELGRIGGRAPSPVELTATERRVASLVARGLPNREVAAKLFVTIRTVEAHLSRIYGKLGVRSRAELAHRLASGEGSEERTEGTSLTERG